MTLLCQILRFGIVMLFSVLGPSMAFAVPMGTSEISFCQADNAFLSENDDVGFAARAPPLAACDVEVTGGVTVMQGGAFALHGQEAVAALFGFDADHIATNTGVRNLDGFSGVEVGIINEADGILSSSQMATIRQAYENGESVTVVINGRTIQYEPDLPASGMTMFGEDGFLIGREAFANPGELDRTVLHELHRLTTSQSASGVSGSLATNETQAAIDFAIRAFEAMNP